MDQPNPETLELAPGYVVSRIAKGHWQLAARHGPARDLDDAVEDMRRFVEAGITAFDCADHYVGVEDAIGAFRRRHPSLAQRVRVSTKVVPDQTTLATLRKSDLEQIVDTSLRRLGVERLDLAQFHWWDYDVPGCTQAMLWLQELQHAGKIAHLGITNFDTAHLRSMLDAGVKLLTHQLQYSLLDLRPARGRDRDLQGPAADRASARAAEVADTSTDTMTALCQAHGIHLLCYGTVAGGFLSERWLDAAPPTPPYPNRSLVKYRLIIEEFGGWNAFQQLLKALKGIADRHGCDIATVATRWVLDQPQVAMALVGARDASHLKANLSVFELRLDASERARLDALAHAAPGPLGDCYTLERIKNGPHAVIMQTNQNTQGAPATVMMAPPLATTAANSAAGTTPTLFGDAFELYDLRVEVIESDKPFVMHAKVGDTFDVIGGRVVFPTDRPSFSLYGLLAVLPFIPAKQRPTHPNDWMTSDCVIASTDPACGARFRITRLGPRTHSHADYSVVPVGSTNG